MKLFTIVLLALLSLGLVGCPEDSGSLFDFTESEMLTIESGDAERQFYVRLPKDYAFAPGNRPLIFAYHGTGGTYQAWLNGFYDLDRVVADEAIMVYPQALPDAAGTNQWDYLFDFEFFEDMLFELSLRYVFDANRIFVTGHSSGGGIAHEIGCRFGDIVRGIAPVAGGLLRTECTGAVAIMQIHGQNDALVPVGIADVARGTWVAYNGFDFDITGQTLIPPCVDHSLDVGDYPFYWCLHDEGSSLDFSGHDWPSFAGQAMWSFFSHLADVEPGADPPPGGGNDKILDLFDTTLAFTLRYPPTMGKVVRMAVAVYPEGTINPVGAPSGILSTGFDPANAGPGETVDYVVPVSLRTVSVPGTYSIQVAIYIEGGGSVIPVSGIDHVAIRDQLISDKTSPIVINGIIDAMVTP